MLWLVNGPTQGRRDQTGVRPSKLVEMGKTALDSTSNGLSAVDRALIILEALADAPQGLTVTDLSDLLHINKGLTHRILASLVQREYVFKDEITQRYRISIRLLGLAFRHLRVLDVYDVLLPILRRLARETGELAELNWVEQGRMVTVAKADSPSQLRVVSLLGEEQALHASAAGKLYLASLSTEDALRRAIVQGLTEYTPHTIVTLEGLSAELERVREQGFATNVRETSPHVLAVAAPIRAQSDDGRVVGSVGVVAPDFHEIHRDPVVIEQTKRAADEISHAWPLVHLEV
jgi:IclR family acetate operon transcriptional repressor